MDLIDPTNTAGCLCLNDEQQRKGSLFTQTANNQTIIKKNDNE